MGGGRGAASCIRFIAKLFGSIQFRTPYDILRTDPYAALPPFPASPEPNPEADPNFVYRAMRGDLVPELGETAEKLGVRVGVDIFPNGDIIGPYRFDTKEPQGLSVRPSLKAIPLRFLPKSRFPGGESNKNKVWKLNKAFIGGDLKYIEDQLGVHGLLSPSKCMQLLEYKRAIGNTQAFWVPYDLNQDQFFEEILRRQGIDPNSLF